MSETASTPNEPTVSPSPPAGKKSPFGVIAVVIAVLALIVAVQASTTQGPDSPASSSNSSTAAVAVATGDTDLFEAPEDLGALIKQVQASTVTIRCKGSQGSGWVIDLGAPADDAGEEALELDAKYPNEVITNHHVIEECVDTPGKVRALAGDVEYDAYLYTWDEKQDLALVAISQDVPALAFSKEPKPGWWAMAVGTPYGLEGSVSIGNVMNTEATDVISTTPLNSGNSGGPLVNAKGEVMATNTAVYVEDDAQDWNIAVSIPALCKEVVACDAGSDLRWD